MQKTLILGLGNPILSDDAIGLKVSRELGKHFPDADIVEASISGISLIDYITGYDHLIIIDSIKTGEAAPGTVHRIDFAALKPTVAEGFPHGVNIATAFEIARQAGEKIPKTIDIYAIEVKDNTTFSEKLTPALNAKSPQIVEDIIRDLQNIT